MARIGIFSGTFDPIHDGHVLFAQAAVEQMGLEKVVFLVERKPRRKEEVTAAEDRIKMVDIIVKKAPLFDQLVAKEETMDVESTLQSLREKYPEDDLIFLMGADLFEHVPDWPNAVQLLTSCGFIIALRTEDEGEIAIPLAKEIEAEAEFIPSPLGSVSSSSIRQAIASDEPPKGLDDQVEEYMSIKKLYN